MAAKGLFGWHFLPPDGWGHASGATHHLPVPFTVCRGQNSGSSSVCRSRLGPTTRDGASVCASQTKGYNKNMNFLFHGVLLKVSLVYLQCELQRPSNVESFLDKTYRIDFCGFIESEILKIGQN